jgi:DNA-binding MarR family transcriptional regulator
MIHPNSKINKILTSAELAIVTPEQLSKSWNMLETLEELISELREFGVSLAALHAVVWLYLHEDKEICLGQLASGIGMSKAAITHVVDLIEKQGFAKRIANKLDRRSVFVRLTPSGRALARWVSFKISGVNLSFQPSRIDCSGHDELQMLTS